MQKKHKTKKKRKLQPLNLYTDAIYTDKTISLPAYVLKSGLSVSAKYLYAILYAIATDRKSTARVVNKKEIEKKWVRGYQVTASSRSDTVYPNKGHDFHAAWKQLVSDGYLTVQAYREKNAKTTQYNYVLRVFPCVYPIFKSPPTPLAHKDGHISVVKDTAKSFVTIPQSILLSPFLPPTSKMLYAVMRSFLSMEKDIAGYKVYRATIMDSLHISRRTYDKYFRILKLSGYLKQCTTISNMKTTPVENVSGKTIKLVQANFSTEYQLLNIPDLIRPYQTNFVEKPSVATPTATSYKDIYEQLNRAMNKECFSDFTENDRKMLASHLCLFPEHTALIENDAKVLEDESKTSAILSYESYYEKVCFIKEYFCSESLDQKFDQYIIDAAVRAIAILYGSRTISANRRMFSYSRRLPALNTLFDGSLSIEDVLFALQKTITAHIDSINTIASIIFGFVYSRYVEKIRGTKEYTQQKKLTVKNRHIILSKSNAKTIQQIYALSNRPYDKTEIITSLYQYHLAAIEREELCYQQRQIKNFQARKSRALRQSA